MGHDDERPLAGEDAAPKAPLSRARRVSKAVDAGARASATNAATSPLGGRPPAAGQSVAHRGRSAAQRACAQLTLMRS